MSFSNSPQRVDPPIDECPSSELLMQVFVGDAKEEERAVCASHLAGCDACAEVMRELRPFAALEEHVAGESGAIVTSIEDHRRRREAPVAATIASWAAAVLAALGLGAIALQLAPSAPQGPVRGGSEAWQVEPSDLAIVGTAPQFTWHSPYPEGEGWLVLFDAQSREIWRSPISTDDRVALPAAVFERLEPSATYYWRIEERAGVEVHQSPLSSFVVGDTAAASP